MNRSVILKDPFRFFFPLGGLAGLLGVGLWLPLIWGEANSYPLRAHRLTMIGGFLLAFATGFLTTAIPRFTSSWFLRGWELVLLAVSLFAAIACGLSRQIAGHHIAVTLTIIILGLFALRRFLNRSENPPFTSIFVAAGLVLWAAASLLLALDPFQPLPAVYVAPANAIYTHGALLCLVIGVGGRLVPGLLGWERIVLRQRDRYEDADTFQEAIPRSLWVALLVFLVSYGLEARVQPPILWFLRGMVLLYIAMRYWKLYCFPNQRTGFTWGVWISAWSFVLGMLMPVIWPSGGVHGVHMIFIGGFSLLTILVATRVTLAHGTEGKQWESSSRILKVLLVLFVLAMVTRVTAILSPTAYRSHLGYAALLWIIGMILWAIAILPRILTDYEIPRPDQ